VSTTAKRAPLREYVRWDEADAVRNNLINQGLSASIQYLWGRYRVDVAPIDEKGGPPSEARPSRRE
jgi:hypothetical protein